MRVKILPSRACGSVSAPPSKSMAHRMLICAGLCEGVSTIRGIEASEDILATLDCLAAIGATYKMDGNCVELRGVDVRRASITAPLPCRESGSTLRFFIPLALIGAKPVLLTGAPRLLERPQSVYEALCTDRGLGFCNDGEKIEVCGPLVGGRYSVRGDVSSQFISGLLLALPLLEGESEIVIEGKLESRPYIDLTLSALATFGIRAEWKDERTLAIAGGQRYLPADVTVEGDYSNAAFFEALNLLGGRVEVTGLSQESLQGDRAYKKYFEALSAGEATLDLADCPDLAPILMALAAELHGATLTGTARLRIKESDRATAMARELARLGAKVEIEADRVRVRALPLHPPTEPLCGHNDHRIVMALSILLTRYGGEIDGAEAVAKSLPDFFERLQELGIGMTV